MLILLLGVIIGAVSVYAVNYIVKNVTLMFNYKPEYAKIEILNDTISLGEIHAGQTVEYLLYMKRVAILKVYADKVKVVISANTTGLESFEIDLDFTLSMTKRLAYSESVTLTEKEHTKTITLKCTDTAKSGKDYANFEIIIRNLKAKAKYDVKEAYIKLTIKVIPA